jgi:hypothetical protein
VWYHQPSCGSKRTVLLMVFLHNSDTVWCTTHTSLQIEELYYAVVDIQQLRSREDTTNTNICVELSGFQFQTRIA